MLDWSDVLKASVPLVLAIIGWQLNEKGKRRWEQYKRKEERYMVLLNSVRGFYENADQATAQEDKNAFIQQLSVAWLYCPDSVIRNGYRFLDCVRTGVRKSDDEKEQALGEFIVSMREDLIGKYCWNQKQRKLNASDFRHFRSN